MISDTFFEILDDRTEVLRGAYTTVLLSAGHWLFTAEAAAAVIRFNADAAGFVFTADGVYLPRDDTWPILLAGDQPKITYYLQPGGILRMVKVRPHKV